MEYLENHEYFEQLIGRSTVPEGVVMPSLVILYFTAGWCGACKRLNLERIMGAGAVQPKWLKVDVDLNSYTSGYCNIRSIPTFICVRNGVIAGQIGSSDTNKVIEWVEQMCAKQ